MWNSDIALFLAINASPQSPSALLALARFISLDVPAVAGALVVAAIIAGSPAVRRLAFSAVLSLLLAWLAARFLRAAVPFPRPAALGIGLQWIAHGKGAGFPSLHTAGAFALAFPLLFARRYKAFAAAGMIAAAMGWSRIYTGVHLPSDVAAGAITGVLCAMAAWTLVERWEAYRTQAESEST